MVASVFPVRFNKTGRMEVFLMKKKVYRTAIYARLSKDDKDRSESNSIASQKMICEEYISKSPDLELVETYVDDGYTGVNVERPDFKRLEDDLRSGKIDAIVCKDLSRFARNYIDAGKYLERTFPRLGVRFIAINDDYDTLHSNPQSDSFVIPFKNLINDSYCKDISVKVRTNLDVKRKNGEFVGAFAPYGYIKDPENKNHLIIDEYSGGVVRQIFSMYKDGMSVGQIADKLNSLGILSPMEYKKSIGLGYETSFKANQQASWSYKAVKRILTNEVYLGILIQGKRGTPNYKVRVVQVRDEEDWIVVEGTHEPLVSFEDFAAVKSLLGRDTRVCVVDNNDNELSGFLFCADCGQPMVRKTVPSKGKKYYYYVCSSHKRHEGCTSHSISAKETTDVVLNAIKTQVTNVVNTNEALEYIRESGAGKVSSINYDAEIDRITDEIDKCKRMKLRLYESLSEGIIDKKEYADFREQYSRMIEEKESAVKRLTKEKQESGDDSDAEKIWVTLFRQYENIDSISRRVLMALVDKILIHDNHVIEVVFRFMDEYLAAICYIKMNNPDMLPEVAGV